MFAHEIVMAFSLLLFVRVRMYKHARRDSGREYSRQSRQPRSNSTQKTASSEIFLFFTFFFLFVLFSSLPGSLTHRRVVSVGVVAHALREKELREDRTIV